tara:strand:+ start:1013 stop:1204 length:192 start_codon:yes stop_codon:yes gene_type:complete
VVKAVACGAAIRGFESPRSPSKILLQNYLNYNFELTKVIQNFLQSANQTNPRRRKDLQKFLFR